MQYLYVLSILLALAVTGESYNTQHDNFDMKTAVANIDTLKSMVGCFLDTIECETVYAAFKKDLGDAIQTICNTCNDAQKKHFNIFLEALKDKLPEEYKAFRNKYDPQGIHFDKLEANVAGF